jgi:anthranilate 3-monooxygenase (FAD)/4-hydroxyphenylacetate 3-monooxygenase
LEGKEFIEGLRKPREVYVNGEKITDVTTYPAFKRPIESVAKLYDLKHDPRYRDILTYQPEDGEDRCDITYLVPQSRDDLVRKREAYKVYTKASCGIFGRSPEFMNVMLTGMSTSYKWFDQFGDNFGRNVLNYYKYVRDNDLFLTHALGQPQTDRSKASHEQKETFLHLGVKAETKEGIIVSGAKQLSTMGPLTDEILVFPNGRFFHHQDERYALAFAVPVSTPGVKFLCREPLVQDDQRNLYDHPLSSRFEEIDSLVVFDDVLIPWERVFFYKSVDAANRMRAEVELDVSHLGAVRGMVKAGLAASIAVKMADSVKTNVFIQVREKIGKIIAMLRATEAIVYAAEQKAYVTGDGIWKPNREILDAHNILYHQYYETIVQLMKEIGAAGFMLTPTLEDFHGPAKELFNRFFRGAETDGFKRVQIAKLAWDFIGDSTAQRLLLYERYYTGEPMFYAAGFANRADLSEWMEMTDQLLAEATSKISV